LLSTILFQEIGMAKNNGATIGQVGKKGSKVVAVTAAGRDHQVITVASTKGGVMKKPCAKCPWRVDATGEFPASAFRHSASTAYDMATNTFGCHDSSLDNTKTCAGFVLRGADNNLTARMKHMEYRGVSDGGHELHASYRAMAIANGVRPDDEVLKQCRP
jgi:hypothetical protein